MYSYFTYGVLSPGAGVRRGGRAGPIALRLRRRPEQNGRRGDRRRRGEEPAGDPGDARHAAARVRAARRSARRRIYDMALPIGEGQTISPPFIVAYMTEAIDPQPTDKVLEIGTGSGYQAAVLSKLVARGLHDRDRREAGPQGGRRPRSGCTTTTST